MTAAEYLGKVKRDADAMAALGRELEDARRMAASISSPSSGMPSRPTGQASDRTARTAVRLAELEEEISRQREAYVGMKIAATRMAGEIADPRYRRVISCYYIRNMTLEQTAEEMRRSYQNICHLKKMAVLEFQKVMDSHGVG